MNPWLNLPCKLILQQPLFSYIASRFGAYRTSRGAEVAEKNIYFIGASLLTSNKNITGIAIYKDNIVAYFLNFIPRNPVFLVATENA